MRVHNADHQRGVDVMFWTLLLLGAGGWFLRLVWQALHSGEVQQPRGRRIYNRDSEPVAYWLSVLVYGVCAALGLGYGSLAFFGLLPRA